MNPASRIISALGGPSKVARAVGVHRTRVSNWKRSREVGGTGGLIPQRHIPSLLAFARAEGVALSPADFLPDDPAAGMVAPIPTIAQPQAPEQVQMQGNCA